MIEYIYLVKCPDRSEEPFDFFDEAKDFAIGCLGSNPIITQIEVDRNDFGECVDSRDLGTIWSWEDMVKETETEPAASVFTKDDLVDYVPETDPEFAALDNTLDAEVLDTIPDNFRKPIPDGMTIKDLVEEMEENEDTVECTWCEDLFEKSECRYEVDLGWLCDRCQAAIMSRGEPLTFRENNYWDFLDEDIDNLAEAYTFKNIERISEAKEKIILALEQAGFGRYLATDTSENIFKPLLLKDSAGFSYGQIIDLDVTPEGTVNIVTTTRNIDLAFACRIVRGTKPNNARGLIHAIKDAVETIDKAHALTRAQRAAQRAEERLDSVLAMLKGDTVAAAELTAHVKDITFKVPLKDDYEYVLDEEDEDYEAAIKQLTKLRDRFDELPFAKDAIAKGVAVDREIRASDKYWQIANRWYNSGIITFDCDIKDLVNSKHIIEAAKVESMSNTGNIAELDNTNSTNCFNLAAALIIYNDNNVQFFKKYTEESVIEAVKSVIEELEDADTYRERLTLCPECGGATTFDTEAGMCINCGFNILTEDTASDKIEAACKEKVELDYSNIEVTGMSAKRDVDDWDEWTELYDFVYEVDKQDVIETLFDYIQEEDVVEVGGLEAFNALSDDDAWLFMIDNFDVLFEKYEQKLLKHYEDSAAEAAQEDYFGKGIWD